MPSPLADLIVLNTLSMLAGHGYGVGGYCLDCRRLFAVSLTVLTLERRPRLFHDTHGAAAVPGMRANGGRSIRSSRHLRLSQAPNDLVRPHQCPWSAMGVELRLELDHAYVPGGILPAMRGVLPVGPAIGQLVGRVEGA
jgi:hypothetical protein